MAEWAQRSWWWLASFKLTLGALVASLSIGWWLRVEILMWLLAPALWVWGRVVPPAGLHWNVGPSGPPYLLAVLGVAWLPVVPFLASDVWRLLRPRFDARAARLEIPFALSSLLVTLATVLIIRHHSIALFGFMMAFGGGAEALGR